MIVWWVFATFCLFWNAVAPIESTKDQSIVLTLDISESMESRSRITKLEDALRNWIEFDIPDGINLGMVQFSSSAKLLSGLVSITNESRQHLVQLIPRIAQGETCIGCGLRLALQLIESTESGGMVILITDVENSEPGQDVQDMFDQVKQARAKIVTIALGDGAKLDDIEHLAELTGGVVYSIRDEERWDQLLNALRSALTLYEVEPTAPAATTFDDTPSTNSYSEADEGETDKEPDLTTTTTDLSHLVTNPSSVDEEVHSKTNVQSSESVSSFSYVIIGIVVGIIMTIIMLAVLVVFLSHRYTLRRIQGKYVLARLQEERDI